RHAERFDGVPRREGNRDDARARDRGALTQLRGVCPPDPRTGCGRADARAPRPLLPDRAPLSLQRQVRPSLGAPLPRLRGRAGAAAGRPRGDARRGTVAPARRPRVRRWLPPLLALIALALVPWALWLGTVLPSHEVAEHWDIAWAGFDLILA